MRLAVTSILLASTFCAADSITSGFDELTKAVQDLSKYLNTVQGDGVCNYRDTTQAINQGAKINQGSACPRADVEASRRITSVSREQSVFIDQLRGRENSASTSGTIAAFQRYATATYDAWNALDLWECRIKATPTSRTHAALFDEADNLKDGFNGIVAELGKSAATALQLAGTNLKQHTHFAGTALLATQVDSAKPVALSACKVITAIVEAEGGGVVQ